ncbi:LPPG:FO 2-phospho-L-lactate transferase [Rhodopseudomonas palustris HaA2]|uniref:LPPG:FO 2-phospho-L-lactate transferase n=1 Tax=Rhodopseudomonas palustris (strain HaA2) TaxID=316058 RepID=Q2IRR7_RHOP2|nr:2-phospho-L-lactate transferase [Rhodopseudomonas palustris]ABD09093.1 LPPG:FO 2-phospho-L-lactate transferase [Rhodopseudomonas palustris HaA2]
MTAPVADDHIIALAGGVGGAKLADGLAHALGDKLTVIVNTGDDFEHLGFHISPDLDTVTYTLGGVANAQQGWGLEGETWGFMEQLARLGGPAWFKLGDRDLATHAYRTNRLREGATLTEVAAELSAALGIAARLLPMSDDAVRTVIHSGGRAIAFQEYFVRLACGVPVDRIAFAGAAEARLNPAIGALPQPAAVIICPSNPYLSIDPILAVPGARAWLTELGVPIVVVSPIVGGAAIKGPAAKIMQELNAPVSALGVAAHYRGLVDGIVIDRCDEALAPEIASLGMAVHVVPTVMRSHADRVALADSCLDFARALIRTRAPHPDQGSTK